MFLNVLAAARLMHPGFEFVRPILLASRSASLPAANGLPASAEVCSTAIALCTLSCSMSRNFFQASTKS